MLTYDEAKQIYETLAPEKQQMIRMETSHILEMDRAYPDVGMGMGRNAAFCEAIERLGYANP